MREVSRKVLWKNFLATDASASVLYPMKQNRRDLSPFFMILASVTNPLDLKCSFSLSSVTCLGMFLTINLLVAKGLYLFGAVGACSVAAYGSYSLLLVLISIKY
jgi:hypothetical protein